MVKRGYGYKIVLVLVLVAVFAVSVSSAFAQTPIPPPTMDELLTESVSFVEQFGVMVAVFAVIIAAMGIWVWTKLRRGAK